MATVTKLGNAFNTSSGTKTVTATPAYGDLVVIFTAHTGNTSAALPTDDNASSPGTYTEISACACVKASSADQMRVFIRNHLIYNAASTIFTHAPGTSTGGGLSVFAIRPLSRTGAGAARQGAKQDNQASGTPTPVLGSAADTNNAMIGLVFNATNPAGMTPRTGWTEDGDSGWASPTTGIEQMRRDNGETATSIAWGSSSASAFCATVIELDCSAEKKPIELVTETMTPPRT